MSGKQDSEYCLNVTSSLHKPSAYRSVPCILDYDLSTLESMLGRHMQARSDAG